MVMLKVMKITTKEDLGSSSTSTFAPSVEDVVVVLVCAITFCSMSKLLTIGNEQIINKKNRIINGCEII
jgi:hypothetical protein